MQQLKTKAVQNGINIIRYYYYQLNVVYLRKCSLPISMKIFVAWKIEKILVPQLMKFSGQKYMQV